MPDRGLFHGPVKSAYSCERYDSGLELQMMKRLEADPGVRKWTKKHGIVIAWVDERLRRRKYRPDFLVEMTDGARKIVEVKGSNMMDSASVRLKADSARKWCAQRGIEYEIATIP